MGGWGVRKAVRPSPGLLPLPLPHKGEGILRNLERLVPSLLGGNSVPIIALAGPAGTRPWNAAAAELPNPASSRAPPTHKSSPLFRLQTGTRGGRRRGSRGKEGPLPSSPGPLELMPG